MPQERRNEMNNEKEKIYMKDQNILITSKIIEIENKIYSLKNINSVSLNKGKPNYWIPAIFLITAFFMLSMEYTKGFGLFCLLIGIVIAILKKPLYIVEFTTSSGQVQALSHKDKEYIKKIVNQIKFAIAEL